jgi:hypothetical protein
VAVYGRPDVTFHPLVRQLWLEIAVVAIAFAVAAAVGDSTLVVLALVALVYLLLLWRLSGTHVTSNDLVLLGFRHRRVPWTQVQEIEERSQFGGRGLLVIEKSGRRTLLKAPREGRLAPDPDFDAKRDQVISAWKAGRGDWRPAARPGDDG